MLSLKTNGLDKHAKGMSLHLGYFDTASFGFVCAGEMSGPETRHAGLCGGVVAAEVTVNHAGEADVEREQHRYQSKHHKEGDEGYIDKSDDVAENKECHQPAYGH